MHVRNALLSCSLLALPLPGCDAASEAKPSAAKSDGKTADKKAEPAANVEASIKAFDAIWLPKAPAIAELRATGAKL